MSGAQPTPVPSTNVCPLLTTSFLFSQGSPGAPGNKGDHGDPVSSCDHLRYFIWWEHVVPGLGQPLLLGALPQPSLSTPGARVHGHCCGSQSMEVWALKLGPGFCFLKPLRRVVLNLGPSYPCPMDAGAEIP